MVTIERQRESIAAPYGRRLWTTAEYYKMADAGILDPHDRVELIYGEVVKLAPVGPEHNITTIDCYDRVRDLLGLDFSVLHESPVSFLDGTEPQPDLVVARGSRTNYRKRHPGPDDICLLIEVCATTLASDRKRKLPMYARFSIAEVWIVNLVDRQIEVFRDPHGNRYNFSQIYKQEEAIEMSFAPGKSIGVKDLLPY